MRNSKVFSVLIISVLISTIVLSALVLAQATTPKTWQEIIGYKALGNVLLYIFGQPVAYEGIAAISAGIITIAVWMLFFITFSDIIATFSTFHKWVSWGTGFLITLIAANLGWVMKGFVYMTGIFAFLGGLAVYFGLGIAFVTFIVANLGLFYIKRAMMKQAMKAEAMEDEKGASRVSSAIKSLGETEKAFKGVGNK